MTRRRWAVYIVRCADGTLYTGAALDAARRVVEHNEGRRGARYTRARRPVRLVYQEPARSRSAAFKREAALKRLTRARKEALLSTQKSKPTSNSKSRALRSRAPAQGAFCGPKSCLPRGAGAERPGL